MAAFSSYSEEARFADLVASCQHCGLCPRLSQRTKVLSRLNGSLDARVLFVAEAPGRLGADRTGRPLYGDQTGDNFETLLRAAGWSRESVFITNAVLCNPRDDDGNNATPTMDELDNCSSYLEMVITLVSPAVIASLGTSALAALSVIGFPRVALRDSVGRPHVWGSRVVVPLYHPGPRALVHRSLSEQCSDFASLAQLVDPHSGMRADASSAPVSRAVSVERVRTPDPLTDAVLTIVEALGKVSFFKLTKLLYLADLLAIRETGRSVTGRIWLRQAEGPWSPDLRRCVDAMDGFEVTAGFQGGSPAVTLGRAPRFTAQPEWTALEVLVEVIARYGGHTNAKMKTAAYLTSPMRYILREERRGRDMRGVPVIYQDRTVEDLDRGRAPAMESACSMPSADT